VRRRVASYRSRRWEQRLRTRLREAFWATRQLFSRIEEGSGCSMEERQRAKAEILQIREELVCFLREMRARLGLGATR
jgi:hypothetical protein